MYQIDLEEKCTVFIFEKCHFLQYFEPDVNFSIFDIVVTITSFSPKKTKALLKIYHAKSVWEIA